MIDKKVMETLRENVGKRVRVEHVWYGTPQTDEKVLKEVTDFVNIEIEGSGIPFVGYGSAIRKIIGENEEILYENPIIPLDYDLRRDEEIEKVVAQSFGDEIATERRQKREAEKKGWEAKVASLDAEAKTKTSGFMEEGENLIKPELKDEWKEFVSNNTKDFYSAGVVEASLRVMKTLSEGKSPKKAEAAVYGMGITGFQMGCVAQAVTHFHPRGEEFRKYWNRQYLSKEEAKKAKGVVNPAILTISPK